jgi:hypothetical protein
VSGNRNKWVVQLNKSPVHLKNPPLHGGNPEANLNDQEVDDKDIDVRNSQDPQIGHKERKTLSSQNLGGIEAPSENPWSVPSTPRSGASPAPGPFRSLPPPPASGTWTKGKPEPKPPSSEPKRPERPERPDTAESERGPVYYRDVGLDQRTYIPSPNLSKVWELVPPSWASFRTPRPTPPPSPLPQQFGPSLYPPQTQQFGPAVYPMGVPQYPSQTQLYPAGPQTQPYPGGVVYPPYPPQVPQMLPVLPQAAYSTYVGATIPEGKEEDEDALRPPDFSFLCPPALRPPRPSSPEICESPKPSATFLMESTATLNKIRGRLMNKLGTKGQRIMLDTNHFRVDVGPLTYAYRYDVTIIPGDIPRTAEGRLMEEVRRQFYRNYFPTFSPPGVLYSAKKLPLANDCLASLVRPWRKARKKRHFFVTVKLSGIVDLSPLQDLQQNHPREEEAFKLLEEIFKQTYVGHFLSYGRRFFFRKHLKYAELSPSTLLHVGGRQSVSKGWIPFLNVDVACMTFTAQAPLLQTVRGIISRMYRPPKSTDVITEAEKNEVSYFLTGMKLRYQRRSGARYKTYRVVGLKDCPSKTTFMRKGEEITVEEYFTTVLGLTVREPEMPTVWLGTKNKTIYVPITCCTLHVGQPINNFKELGSVRAGMVKHSSTVCEEHKKKLDALMNELGHNTNRFVREFGFSISNEYEKVEGRILEGPDLLLKGIARPVYSGWDSQPFLVPKVIKYWKIVYVGKTIEDFDSLAKHLSTQVKQKIGKTKMTWVFFRS